MWNEIRFATNVILARLLRRNIPLCVGIHITSRCNFNCIYCYGGYSKKNVGEFTTKQLISLIDELKQKGTLWITLTGGEPLLRDDIELIIDKIKKENIICSINTNGSLIKEKIDAVKKIDFITVSLDGNEAANDMNRGKGTFKVAIEGIKCLKDNKIPFDVVSVLTRHNINSIDAMLDLAERMSFYVEFNFLEDQNAPYQDHSSFSIDDKDMKDISRKLIEYKKKGRHVFYSAGSRRYVLGWPLSYKEKMLFRDIPHFKPIHCYMGERMCHIDYDGKVYPCNQLAGRFPALSFLESGFEKSWENLKNKKNCKACYAVCFAEFNRFFALAPDVWINNIIQTLRSKIHRK